MFRYRRRQLMALCLLAWLVLAIPVAAQEEGPVTVRVTPAELQVAPGAEAEFAVAVVDVTGLYGVDLALSFDPDLVEVVDANPSSPGIQVAQGTFLDSGFVVRNQADNSTGTIWFVMTQLNPSPPQDGTGNLIVVRLRAGEAAGAAALELTGARLARSDGTEIQVTPVSGQVRVVEEAGAQATNTPLPTQAPGTPLPTEAPATATPTGGAGSSSLAVTPTADPTNPPATATPRPTSTPLPSPTVSPATPTPLLEAAGSGPSSSQPLGPDEVGLAGPGGDADALPGRLASPAAGADAMPETVATATATVITGVESEKTPQALAAAAEDTSPMAASAGDESPAPQEEASRRDNARTLLLGIGVASLSIALFIAVALAFILRRSRTPSGG